MDGTFNKFPGAGGYTPVHKGVGGYQETGFTPNFEVMEGMRFGQFYPAPYLPVKRLDPVFMDYVVIPAGAPVAIDASGYLVPAGYAIAGAGEEVYADQDVLLGTLKFDGTPAGTGQSAKGAAVGLVIGVASYDVYQRAGSDPQNPATFKYHNYQRQNGVAVLTDYLLEFPIEPTLRKSEKTESVAGVAAAGSVPLTGSDGTGKSTDVLSIMVKIDGIKMEETAVGGTANWAFVAGALDADIDSITFTNEIPAGAKLSITYEVKQDSGLYNALFKGMTTCRGDISSFTYDKLIGFDLNSKYIAIDKTTASADPFSVMGKITLIEKGWPKQLLDRVKTVYDPRTQFPVINPETGATSKMDQQPGSATQGVNGQMWYAGVTAANLAESALIRFNMNI
jgi:hypothetical protein